jgi:hypothetical protein
VDAIDRVCPQKRVIETVRGQKLGEMAMNTTVENSPPPLSGKPPL